MSAVDYVRLDTMVGELMEEWKVPGLSIAIVHGSDIKTRAYGYARLPAERCTPDTIFNLASVSKSTTAAAVARIVDSDKYPHVQWDTPVSAILGEDFVLPSQSLTEQVSVEDILSHRSGIPGHDESYLGITAQFPDNAESMTRNLRNLPFTKPLRTTFQYSNIMFTVATHLVETISGMDYTQFLREELWKPLGMMDTFQDRPDAESVQDRFAMGYRWDDGKQDYISIPQLATPEGRGAGEILSSANDYAKWLRALMLFTLPMSKETQQELITPRSIEMVDEENRLPHYGDCLYGLGLYRDVYRGRTLINHGGAVAGFKTKLLYLPELAWGAVLLANGEDGFYLNNIIAHTLIDEVLGIPDSDGADLGAVFRRWREEDRTNTNADLVKSNEAMPLPVALEKVAGTYSNAGYKQIKIDIKEGSLFADCSDRCFPFTITFEHLTGTNFCVNLHDSWEDQAYKKKAEIRVDEKGSVVAVGIEFEKELQDLTWFARV